MSGVDARLAHPADPEPGQFPEKRFRLGYVLRIVMVITAALLILIPILLGFSFMSIIVTPFCGGGFDPARDIAAITVNRWPHGYAYTYNSLYEPMEWVYTSSLDRPCVKARQPFGRITIANSDAAASPHTDAAFLEASRAVGEVLERRAFPFLTGKPATSSSSSKP